MTVSSRDKKCYISPAHDMPLSHSPLFPLRRHFSEIFRHYYAGFSAAGQQDAVDYLQSPRRHAYFIATTPKFDLIRVIGASTLRLRSHSNSIPSHWRYRYRSAKALQRLIFLIRQCCYFAPGLVIY